jgi:chromosome segregation ATPase
MIPTWQEQAKKDPDWDSGMITNQMIQEKMQEEIDSLRSKVDKMQDDIVSLTDDLFAERRECLKLEKELALQKLSDIGQVFESFDRTASHMAGDYVSYCELTDKEITKEWAKFYPDVFHTHLIQFARAILKKASEK